MTPHQHPGAFLRQCLDALGATQAELSEWADISQKHLSQVITGKASMSADIALRLEEALYAVARDRWRAENWMAMQGHYDVEQARARAKAERA